MQFEVDADKFDRLQPWYVGEFIEKIKKDLTEAGVDESKLKDLCGTIAFSVCTQIDSSSTFEVDGVEYDTILAFSNEDDKAFFTGASSYLHDYVYGVLDEVFEDGV